MLKVTYIHCCYSGIFGFEDTEAEIVESVGVFELKVQRISGARGKVGTSFLLLASLYNSIMHPYELCVFKCKTIACWHLLFAVLEYSTVYIFHPKNEFLTSYFQVRKN